MPTQGNPYSITGATTELDRHQIHLLARSRTVVPFRIPRQPHGENATAVHWMAPVELKLTVEYSLACAPLCFSHVHA